ncbi:MAG: zinc ribbon domain-containing protein [Armatimonadota bacterium]|jgi:putative FmdB family regulatory protein
MPIHEYKCDDCGAMTETLTRRGDADPTCDECGSPNVKRQLSTFAVGGDNCTGVGMCERHPDGAPAACPPGRCCGIGDA